MTELKKVEVTMSSRELAELTGKRHDNVIRDIRYLEVPYLEVYVGALKFEVAEYKDDQGKPRLEYRLTKSQTLFIVSSYDARVRAQIQKRWEELEEAARVMIPPTRLELAVMMVDAIKEIEKKDEQLILQAPDVRFVKEVFEVKDLLLVTEAAKIMGRTVQWLYKQMREDGMVFKHKNLPTKDYQDEGYFEVKMKYYKHHSKPQMMVTQKGLKFLMETFGGTGNYTLQFH